MRVTCPAGDAFGKPEDLSEARARFPTGGGLENRLRRQHESSDFTGSPCPPVNKQRVRHQIHHGLTGNERLNVLHRFVGRCGCPSRPESYPVDTRTEYPHRMSWLSRSRGVRRRIAASALPCAHRRGAHSPHDATRGCSPFAALAAATMRSPSDFQESNRIRLIVDHECRERVGSIQRDVSPLLNRGTNIQAMSLQSR